MDWQHPFLFKLNNRARTISGRRLDLPSRRYPTAISGRDVEYRSYDTVLIYADSTANVSGRGAHRIDIHIF